MIQLERDYPILFNFFPLAAKYSQPFWPHLPLDPLQRLGDGPLNWMHRRHRRLARFRVGEGNLTGDFGFGFGLVERMFLRC